MSRLLLLAAQALLAANAALGECPPGQTKGSFLGQMQAAGATPGMLQLAGGSVLPGVGCNDPPPPVAPPAAQPAPPRAPTHEERRMADGAFKPLGGAPELPDRTALPSPGAAPKPAFRPLPPLVEPPRFGGQGLERAQSPAPGAVSYRGAIQRGSIGPSGPADTQAPARSDRKRAWRTITGGKP